MQAQGEIEGEAGIRIVRVQGEKLAQPAQTVAQWVEDIQSEEARDKYPRKICAHEYRLPSLLSFS